MRQDSSCFCQYRLIYERSKCFDESFFEYWNNDNIYLKLIIEYEINKYNTYAIDQRIFAREIFCCFSSSHNVWWSELSYELCDFFVFTFNSIAVAVAVVVVDIDVRFDVRIEFWRIWWLFHHRRHSIIYCCESRRFRDEQEHHTMKN